MALPKDRPGADATDLTPEEQVVYDRMEAEHESGRKFAWDRDESEPCEAGTPGCSIDHNRDKSPLGCDVW